MADQPIKQVDLFINGRSYAINCPVDEEPALARAGEYINQFIQDIRRQAPQLPQEELLVLCALTLFEKAEKLDQLQTQHTEANALVTEMLTQVSQA
jgi:cell division protein ZapA